MKNIYHKKTSLFYPEDGFHPKILHGLSEEPNPFLWPIFFITVLTEEYVIRYGVFLLLHKLKK